MPIWEIVLWLFFAVIMTVVVIGGAIRRPAEGVVVDFRVHASDMARGGSQWPDLRAVTLERSTTTA
jgi:hypothetical protein